MNTLTRIKDYEQEVNEAECLIAYHNEGVRLSRVPFPILRDYQESVMSKSTLAKAKLKPFYRKVEGLHFLSLGRIRVSFCIVSDNVARKSR